MAVRALDDRFDLESWRRTLPRAATRVLFLDYDGTLAPFTSPRDEPALPKDVHAVLKELAGTPRHRLVFVSGRPATALRRWLDFEPRPLIFGSHGMERLGPDGQLRAEQLSERSAAILGRVAREARSAFGDKRVEVKPFGVAMHLRDLPPTTGLRVSGVFRQMAVGAGLPSDLRLLKFDGGVELRALGRDKGDAVKAILAESETPAAAAYLGDDLSDEDGFRAIDGRGISILVRRMQRPTAARAWIQHPDELLAFLRWWQGIAKEAAA